VVIGAFAASLLRFQQLAAVWHADPGAAQIVSLWSWMPVGNLQVAFAFQFDQLSMVLLLVVTGVGSLIHLFSIGYMKADPGYARFFAYLNLFVALMLVLVLGASFPMMFIGWEGVGLCSYLLIGFWFTDKVNADAGKKAFIVNRIGDFGFLVAMFLLWQAFGSLDFREVFARAPEVLPAGGALVTAITLFLFLGCAGKSAQIPLYTWLPDAMAGPTPVSALIHGAVCRDDRPAAVRHQAGAGVFHRLAARLHVPGRGDGGDHVRHFPSGDPRVLQGAAVPGLR
jgi:NADH-quinone oxidoreductase subunit L